MAKPTESSTLLGVPLPPASRLWVNYLSFSASFGCCYGCFQTSATYLSSIFARTMADQGNALSYALWMVVALFFAAPVVSRFGTWRTIVASQVLFALYQLLLLIAASVGPDSRATRWYTLPPCLYLASDSMGRPHPRARDSLPACDVFRARQAYRLPRIARYRLVLAAGFPGGCGASLLWTSQGPYFARAAEMYSIARGRKGVAETTAWFASIFAGTFLGLEVCMRCAAATVMLALEDRTDRLGDSASGRQAVVVYTMLLCVTLGALAMSTKLLDVDTLALTHGTEGFKASTLASVAEEPSGLGRSVDENSLARAARAGLATLTLLGREPRALLLFPINLTRVEAQRSNPMIARQKAPKSFDEP